MKCWLLHIKFFSVLLIWFFFFQAEDGIRDLVRSRGLGDVYKRQIIANAYLLSREFFEMIAMRHMTVDEARQLRKINTCLLYTSDAADERSSVDLGGRRIIKKKKREAER